MAKKQRPPERVEGGYTAFPWRVMDSKAFMGASHIARSLLCDIMRQHNGSNNGRLSCATAYFKGRGWNSTDVIATSKQELLDRGLIVLARQGGLNMGPSGYALTWLPITNYVGLDIRQDGYQQGKWTEMEALPLTKKRKSRTVQRNSTVPLNGTVPPATVPLNGTKTAAFDATAIPLNGNTVSNQYPPAEPRKKKAPIVGRVGKSGIVREPAGTCPAARQGVGLSILGS